MNDKKSYENPALLFELFTYDSDSGRIFHAKDKKSGSGRVVARSGDYADTTIDKGYRRLSITTSSGRHLSMAHRVAWILSNGEIPNGLFIDHINGVRHDNRLTNLRLVTRQQNSHNQHKAKGFSWNFKRGKWQAQILVNRRSISLGMHDTELDARSAYLRAKRIYHPTAPLDG